MSFYFGDYPKREAKEIPPSASTDLISHYQLVNLYKKYQQTSELEPTYRAYLLDIPGKLNSDREPDHNLKDSLFGAQPADVEKRPFQDSELNLGFSLDETPVDASLLDFEDEDLDELDRREQDGVAASSTPSTPPDSNAGSRFIIRLPSFRGEPGSADRK
ncbi:hypothetical protein HDV03_003275 [Kappamyces sp. JEL0829]|nr:hypothetical protein HDV03_003275 [Kappamyces sp. JEL0829]